MCFLGERISYWKISRWLCIKRDNPDFPLFSHSCSNVTPNFNAVLTNVNYYLFNCELSWGNKVFFNLLISLQGIWVLSFQRETGSSFSCITVSRDKAARALKPHRFYSSLALRFPFSSLLSSYRWSHKLGKAPHRLYDRPSGTGRNGTISDARRGGVTLPWHRRGSMDLRRSSRDKSDRTHYTRMRYVFSTCRWNQSRCSFIKCYAVIVMYMQLRR